MYQRNELISFKAGKFGNFTLSKGQCLPTKTFHIINNGILDYKTI